jgi:hypothetical protein
MTPGSRWGNALSKFPAYCAISLPECNQSTRMGYGVKYYPLNVLKKYLAHFARRACMLGSLDSQTLNDKTPKTVPNQHNFIIFVKPPLTTSASFGKANKQSSLSELCTDGNSKFKARETFHGS